MNVRQWIVIVLAACAVGVGSFSASNALSSRRAAADAGMDPGMTPMVSYLQLTPEQQNSIRPIDERFRQERMATCTEMQDARQRLLDVLKQPNTSRASLDTALDDLARAQARLQRQTAEYLLEIKPFLTDEQKDRLFGVVGQRFCGQGRCGAGTCPMAGGGQGRGRHLGRPW